MTTTEHNLVGQKFGMLTVVKRAPNRQRDDGGVVARFYCVCECGGTKIADSSALRRDKVKSCGCLRRQPLKRN